MYSLGWPILWPPRILILRSGTFSIGPDYFTRDMLCLLPVSCSFLAWLTLLSRWWRRYIPPKCLLTFSVYTTQRVSRRGAVPLNENCHCRHCNMEWTGKEALTAYAQDNWRTVLYKNGSPLMWRTLSVWTLYHFMRRNYLSSAALRNFFPVMLLSFILCNVIHVLFEATSPSLCLSSQSCYSPPLPRVSQTSSLPHII
jgi:hypothetical protein